MKDPNKRISLKEVLQHPWLTRDIKGVRDLRRNSLPASAFEAFTQVQPNSGKEKEEKNESE